MAQLTEEFVPLYDWSQFLPSSFAYTKGAGSAIPYFVRTAKTAICNFSLEFNLPMARRSQGALGLGAYLAGFVMPLRVSCHNLVCLAYAHIYQATTYKAGSNCNIVLTSLPLTQSGFQITKSANDNALVATITTPGWDNPGATATGTFQYIARLCFQMACASVIRLYANPRVLYSDTVAPG